MDIDEEQKEIAEMIERDQCLNTGELAERLEEVGMLSKFLSLRGIRDKDRVIRACDLQVNHPSHIVIPKPHVVGTMGKVGTVGYVGLSDYYLI